MYVSENIDPYQYPKLLFIAILDLDLIHFFPGMLDLLSTNIKQNGIKYALLSKLFLCIYSPHLNLQSSLHMSWVNVVCGRLESRYRYSNEIIIIVMVQ